jgi:hypothetical protein
MNALLARLIRTLVPIGVGSAIGWLASLGVVVSNDGRAALVTAVSALASALYYALITWAEDRWPAVGWLLGLAQTPDSYSRGTTPTTPGPDDAGH